MVTRQRYATKYFSTERELPDVLTLSPSSATKQSAYYVLAERIEEEFLPEEIVTLEKIYDHVTRELGLTKKESSHIVKEAVRTGYVRRGRVRL